MILKIIIWKKGKTEINVQRFFCEKESCDGRMHMIGSAGCAHDSEYTYFWQCPVCKTMDSSSHSPERHGYDDASFEQGGWKLK